MSKFLTGKELEETIYDVIFEAQETLLIVSPYIKLDYYFRKLFDEHKKNSKIEIILVFGKNENDIFKSLNKVDLDYFKQFPNISIIYTPNLHAKYYGNETKGVVTSMNLYDYSFLNNIEFGVYTEHTIMTKIGSILTGNQFDNDAWNACMEIAENNNAVYIRRPTYEKKLLASNNYIGSETLHDTTNTLYNGIKNLPFKKLNDFPEEIEMESLHTNRPKREDKLTNIEHQNFGFCIRTGQQIPFNPKYPLSKPAWQTWSQFSNADFPEKFCHKTGKPSYGKTSMRKPILEN